MHSLYSSLSVFRQQSLLSDPFKSCIEILLVFLQLFDDFISNTVPVGQVTQTPDADKPNLPGFPEHSTHVTSLDEAKPFGSLHLYL